MVRGSLREHLTMTVMKIRRISETEEVMATGARFGWFVLLSILVIAAYFYFGMETSLKLVQRMHLVDAHFVSEFVVPALLTLAISVLLGLWWSDSGWKLASIVTSLVFGAFSFPIWFIIAIYIACWGQTHCTLAP